MLFSSQALSRKFRSHLNKLTPEKFDVIAEKVNQLPITDLASLKECVNILQEKVRFFCFMKHVSITTAVTKTKILPLCRSYFTRLR